MDLLHHVDRTAKLFDRMAQDPEFYDAKAHMRADLPEGSVVEIVPDRYGFNQVRIWLPGADMVDLLI